MKKALSLILLSCSLFLQCTEEEATPTPPSDQKAILTFSLLKAENPGLETDINGMINGSKVTVDIPGNILERNLIATFKLSPGAKATINGTEQLSGQTTNDFSALVTYTVEAENKSTATYTVEIKKAGSSPSSTVNLSTSAYLHNNNFVWTNLTQIFEPGVNHNMANVYTARAFYDFDKDGDKDLIAGPVSYGQAGEGVAIDVLYYKNTGGNYQLDQTVFEGSVPKYVHPRQAIIGDYDNNGWMDVILIGQGWDKDPFPGEKQYVLMNHNGKFTTKEIVLSKLADGRLPFTHSGCSGDIDNDGDVDLIYTSNRGASVLIYLNDGLGNFTLTANRAPALQDKQYFTSKAYDINKDGYLDLLIAGHDRDQHTSAEQGAKPMILWGNYTGSFSLDRKTTLPTINKYGVSLSFDFIDFNKDGKTDILIGKTGDGAPNSLPFYQGRYLQLFQNNGGSSFTDVSSKITNNTDDFAEWVVWYLVHDIDGDGDMDISTDDKVRNLQWQNSGGTFSLF